MGLPNHLSLSSWKACRRVVAGRLVNCYSRKDLILSLMYQIKKFGLKPGTFLVIGAFVPFTRHDTTYIADQFQFEQFAGHAPST